MALGSSSQSTYALSLTDQAASASSNALIALAVVRWEGLSAAGDFGIAYSFFLLVLGLSRALFGEPLLQQGIPGTAPDGETPKVRRLAVFGAIGLTLLALSAALGGRSGDYLRVIALGSPVLLIQDYQRYRLFALRRFGWALASDAWWMSLSLAAYLVEASRRVGFVNIWVAGGTSSAVLTSVPLILRARALRRRAAAGTTILPAAGTAAHGLRSWRWPLVAEYVLMQASGQLVILAVAGAAGSVAVGAIRTVATAYGLLFVVYVGTGVAVMTAQETPRFRPILVTFALAGLALAGAIWLLPESGGAAVFGMEGWRSLRGLNLPMCISTIGQGWVFVATLLWRKTGDAGRYLRLGVLTAVEPIVGAWVGAKLGAAPGAAIGLAVANMGNGLVALSLSRRWMSKQRTVTRG